MTLKVTIVWASHPNLEDLAYLFDEYRQFYRQPSDIQGARQFLESRLEARDSKLLVAIWEGRSIGFVQLYPSFSSISMKPIWILNDIYVHPDFRRKGAGKALINTIIEFAKFTQSKGLVLNTAHENNQAQCLYQSFGFKQDIDFGTWYYWV